jgi:hypothetical protein
MLLVVVLFLAGCARLHAQSGGELYVIELKSGDSFRGTLVDSTDSTLTVQGDLGRVSLRRSAILQVVPLARLYRRRPLHFLMPSASANGPGGFISDYELGFLYGGFGIGEVATITAGLTLVPGMPLRSQLYHVNAKVTFLRNETFENAVGLTYTFLTTDHPYGHLYAVWTFPSGRARYSAMIFGALTGAAEAPIAITPLGSDTVRFTFHNNAVAGVAFGLDMPAFGRDDMRWVAELWNSDVTKPANSAAMIGIRLANEHLSADFGVALLPTPTVFPLAAFMWRM